MLELRFVNLSYWRRHAWLNRLQTVLLLGAMAGFLALLGYLLWGSDGLLPLLALGALFAFINPAASPRLVLHLYRARPIAAWEGPQLLDALAELSRRAGLGRPPGLYYVPSRIVNAFAVGGARDAAVAVTDGLLRALAPREIVAVLAHEMSHIRSNDLRVMGLADIISRLTSLLSLVGQFLLILNLPLILWSDVAINWFAIALLVFAPHVSMLAQLGLSRTRELDADLDAARLTGDPAGLARALAKIERLQGSLFERLMLPGMRLPDPSWLRTHPPAEQRIARLLALASDADARSSDGPGPGWWESSDRSGLERRPRYHASGLWY
jgi:heat shock protein HtpX